MPAHKNRVRHMIPCHFCKNLIESAKKTEIYYRERWIDGCNECFKRSIHEKTAKTFQETDY